MPRPARSSIASVLMNAGSTTPSRTGGAALSLPGEPALAIADLRKIHEDWLPFYMAGKAA